MEKFKYMKEEFPELPTTPPQKWENDFDYSRWGTNAKVHLLNCPWGTSEVQVGARSIIGQGNVVKFENDTARDEWFSSQNDITFDIMDRKLNQNYIDLPIPFDVAMTYNYIWIEYNIATSADDKIENETENGLRKVFYFIRDISDEHAAPNCTRFILLMDYWTSYINQIEIKSCFLQRGHLPLSKIDADTYLNDPINNTQYLTAPDVDAGAINRAKTANRLIFNNKKDKEYLPYCVVAFAFKIANDGWNKKHDEHTTDYKFKWNLPEYVQNWEQGVSNFELVAFKHREFYHFLRLCYEREIDAKEAVKAIYYIPQNLITLGSPIDFGESVTGYTITTETKLFDGLELKKEDFNFGEKYENLAKLYTAPYSYIKVSDYAGKNSLTLETQGIKNKIDVEVMTSLVYNSNAIIARLLGVGTSDNNYTIEFFPAENDVDEPPFYFENGREEELEFVFEIPAFSVQMSSYYNGLAHNRWNNYLERQNAKFQYETRQAKGKLNTKNQNIAIETNKANSKRTQNLRSQIKTANNNKLTQDYKADVAYLDAAQKATKDYYMSSSSVNSGVSVNESNIAQSQSYMNDILSFSLTGLLGDWINESTYLPEQQNLTIYSNGANAALSVSNSQAMTAASKNQANTKTNNAKNNNNRVNFLTNSWQQDTTAANTACQKKQLDNNNDFNFGEAWSTKGDYSNGIIKTQYDFQKAAVEYSEKNSAPLPMLNFGKNEEASKFVTMPNGLKFQILKMNDGDVARVGDEFLKYGYTLGQYVNVEDLNVMPKFTYWQCSNIIANYNMPDAFADRIKILLMGGVTVWRKPEDILTTSIYENVSESTESEVLNDEVQQNEKAEESL